MWLNGRALGSAPTRGTRQPDQGCDAFAATTAEVTALVRGGVQPRMSPGTAARQAPLAGGLSQSLQRGRPWGTASCHKETRGQASAPPTDQSWMRVTLREVALSSRT